MNEVRILIVNDNKKNIEDIRNCVETLNYVEVVDSINKGEEVYGNIIELKPDIVFTKFKMHNYNSEDIIKKVSRELGEKKPIFKFISDGTSENKTMYKSKIKKIENNEKIKITRFNYVKELGEKEIIECLEKYYQQKRNQ